MLYAQLTRKRLVRAAGSIWMLCAVPHRRRFALRFYSRMLSVVKRNDAGLKGF